MRHGKSAAAVAPVLPSFPPPPAPPPAATAAAKNMRSTDSGYAMLIKVHYKDRKTQFYKELFLLHILYMPQLSQSCACPDSNQRSVNNFLAML